MVGRDEDSPYGPLCQMGSARTLNPLHCPQRQHPARHRPSRADNGPSALAQAQRRIRGRKGWDEAPRSNPPEFADVWVSTEQEERRASNRRAVTPFRPGGWARFSRACDAPIPGLRQPARGVSSQRSAASSWVAADGWCDVPRADRTVALEPASSSNRQIRLRGPWAESLLANEARRFPRPTATGPGRDALALAHPRHLGRSRGQPPRALTGSPQPNGIPASFGTQLGLEMGGFGSWVGGRAADRARPGSIRLAPGPAPESPRDEEKNGELRC